jgi:SOS-response transcriptional repressor LexA
MDLSNRIKEAMTFAGKNQSQLALEAGISTSAVSQLMTGRVKSLKAETAAALEKSTGYRATWLVTGKGPKFVLDKSNVSSAPIGTRQVPLISYVQAGHWTGAVDPFQPNDAHDWLMTDLELSDGAFALEIKGESMLPEFKPGDRVIIDSQINPQPGDYVVAKNGHEEAMFKKYRPRSVNERGEMVFELVPLNDDYPTIRSDVTPVMIIGTMVEHRKYRRR